MSFGGADGVIWGHTVPFAGAGGRVIKKARVRMGLSGLAPKLLKTPLTSLSQATTLDFYTFPENGHRAPKTP